MTSKKIAMTRKDVADVIEQFLSGAGGEWDWDDFISIPLEDLDLDQIRRTCAQLPELYPAAIRSVYCGEQGIKVLRSILKDLQAQSARTRLP